MYKYVNKIPVGDYDNIHNKGSKCIDLVTMLYSLLEHVKGCKLVDYEEIIHSSYRGYLVNLNIVRYFKHSNRYYDEIDEITLNPSRRSHKKKFIYMIEDCMDRLKIEDILEEVEK